jgi:hypothetical protein
MDPPIQMTCLVSVFGGGISPVNDVCTTCPKIDHVLECVGTGNSNGEIMIAHSGLSFITDTLSHHVKKMAFVNLLQYKTPIILKGLVVYIQGFQVVVMSGGVGMRYDQYMRFTVSIFQARLFAKTIYPDMGQTCTRSKLHCFMKNGGKSCMKHHLCDDMPSNVHIIS